MILIAKQFIKSVLSVVKYFQKTLHLRCLTGPEYVSVYHIFFYFVNKTLGEDHRLLT